MSLKICFFNQSPIHYRKAIYELLDSELSVHFYFGDSRAGGIKEYNADKLINNKKPLHNIYFGPFYWQKGALSLLKSDYNVLLTPGDINCLSTWLIIILARIYKKKIYTWTHGAYGKEGWFRKQAIRFRSRRLSGIFLYGNYAKEILKSYGVEDSKLSVIYNSLDYDEHIQLRSAINETRIYSSHFNNNEKNLIFIGRLTKVKKLDQILHALSILKQKGIICNMTFIGDGTEKASLECLHKELGLDNIWFYGACYDERMIAELIYNADLCISPGNVGLTAMHSMTFGTPVISHRNFAMQMPEFEAIEEYVTGAFFEENNVNSLAASIEDWFRQNHERQIVRENCYQVIDTKYNPHVQIETIKRTLGL